MNVNKTHAWTLCAVALATATFSGAALAQAMDHSAHQAMDHSAHQGMAPTPTPTTPPTSATPAPPDADPAMDHGAMQMQGGAAPPDARDPHAYAGGNTLTSGPYALETLHGLHLSDDAAWSTLLVDRLEVARGNERSSGNYDITGRFGGDYDRLVIKAEGEVADQRIEASRTEALWSHAVAPFWDAQLGLRHDTGPGPGRSWAAFGMQGQAPYGFEIDAAAYLGDNGRTALRLSAEYELLLAQRLVLQPRVEAELYGKSDPENGIGKGLASLSAGLRLRYEFSRQFAPYIGVEWSGRFGDTADLRRAAGERTNETQAVAGVRFWF